MGSLAILVAAAAVGFALSHWLRLPVIPLLILLGFGLSRAGLAAEQEGLNTLLALGLAFLVYSAGIELNPRRFRGKADAVLWTAAVQFGVLALAGFGLAVLLGFERLPALYLGAAMATSSTFVVIRQMQQRPGALRAYGGFAIGVLLAQDLAIIVVIVTLGAIEGGGVALAKSLGALTFLGGLAFAGQRWGFPWILKRARLEDEALLLILLGVLFVFAGMAHGLGLPYVVGAFFAGFSLSSFPVNGVARSLLTSLNSFFLAIFFIALGALVEVPGPGVALKAGAFVLLVLLLTPPIVTLFAEWKGGLSSRNAITSGLLLAQASEFSLVLGLFAVHLEVIPHEIMTIITITAVATMAISPLLASDRVARRLLALHPLRRRLPTGTNLRDHILM
ncbi:MAG: cation:proton antiporter, partial [Akkermansiaceae bacterium]|nr:cation:proton antiporter [Akkermansiaceae bacterium]